ncbi:endochitinase A isoform X3 [Drosophila ficusphila]|uniref:endochitinase A isoform X3 n=1 Tax=Drosophila ficusphila TaxID=30025 RepID=UPI0007E81E8B|nr:endochitinase A isoform X3 [Drosophila ficusphila]
MSACDGSGTVSRTSDASAFQFDVMPKITTPPSTVTPTPTLTSTPTSMLTSAAQATVTVTAKTAKTTITKTTTTVKIENKWPAAEATAFSYQRAAEQIGAKTTPPTTVQRETGINEICTGNPCEELSSKLALRKAQLKANFFGERESTKESTARNGSSKPERTPHFTAYRTAYPSCKTEKGKPVQQLIDQFQAMIVQQQQQQLTGEREAKTLTSNSDEGCNVTGGGLSPYSSDNEDSGNLSPRQRKLKVTRCASSDSALGLEVDDGGMDVVLPPQRRMTLTVTDLPLRPALLPLAEPTALADSPLTSPTGGGGTAGGTVVGVPTKVLLEERVVAAPGSRRESTQSSYSELGGSGFPLGVRYVRTPSVVVSDYSDDITACGISMEEMEYFRLQRARGQRRCSLEAGGAGGGIGGGGGAHGHGGGAHGHGHGGSAMAPGCGKDEGQSDVSAASSCSNLYYCGSTISALDGGECIVNGVRVALARKSSTQSSSLSGEEEEEEDLEDEDLEEHDPDMEDRDVEDLLPEDYERGERERERQISELLAATQLGDRQRDRSKKRLLNL